MKKPKFKVGQVVGIINCEGLYRQIIKITRRGLTEFVYTLSSAETHWDEEDLRSLTVRERAGRK